MRASQAAEAVMAILERWQKVRITDENMAEMYKEIEQAIEEEEEE